MMNHPKSQLTSGLLLAKNTVWNLVGQLLPMVVAVVTIPPLVRGLGVARFGVLSLAWIVVGYFSLFDFGIGRALTKLVADKIGANEEHAIPPLVWTSLALMLLLGVFGGVITSAISPWLIHRALKVPPALQRETLYGFYLLAISIPMVTTTAGLRGILEAQQRFRILNLIRIPMSIFSFAGPLLVLPFSHNLVPVISVLVGGRLLGWVAHQVACFHTMPMLRENFTAKCSLIVPLVKFGGWMSVTNLLGSVMQSIDRFFIGALVSVSAVAYYTAPFDMLSRITVIAQAVVGVLFPAFAVSFIQDPGRIELLLGRSLKYIFLIVFPITLIMVTFAPEGLQLWLGRAFSQNGTTVLRWLAAGVFVNSLSIVPFVLIQSAGRPDITAKLLLAELPLYLAALWLVTWQFGIQGTAIAWTVRLTVEAFLIVFCSLRLLPGKPKFLPKLGIAAVVGLAVLYMASLLHGVATKTAFLTAGLVIFGLAGWSWGLGPSERVFLVGTRAQGPIKVHGD